MPKPSRSPGGPSAGLRGPHAPVRRASWLCVLPLVLGACRSYEPRPLDNDAIRQAWLDRSPASAPARAFAEQLAQAERRPQPFDPTDGLTLAEAEPVALVFNRELRVARLSADVARVTAQHAGRWDDPVAGVDLERILSSVSEPWVVAGTLGLTVPISGRLDAERDHADALHAVELRRLADLEWSTRVSLREHWIEWSAQSHRARLSDDLVRRLADVATLAEKRERAGALSRVDARVFAVELAGAEADRISAGAQLVDLELRLRDMLGLSPAAPITLLESIAFTLRTDAASPPDPKDIEPRNTELSLAREQYQAAERALSLEVRKQYPDLQLGPGYGSDEGDSRLLLALRLPIPLWNRNQQGVAAALAERDAAQARYESAYESLASRLAIAVARFDAAASLRSTVETRTLPLADEHDADVRRVAELGRLEPLLLLQAIKSQHDARVRLVNARAAEAVAAIRLDALLGPPAPRAPADPDSPSPGANP